jgi:hypothetical protein
MSKCTAQWLDLGNKNSKVMQTLSIKVDVWTLGLELCSTFEGFVFRFTFPNTPSIFHLSSSFSLLLLSVVAAAVAPC